MLSLTWYESIREDYSPTLPKMISIWSLYYIPLESIGQSEHKLGTRSNYIWIKMKSWTLFICAFMTFICPTLIQFCLTCSLVLSIFCSSKPACSLLIHFCTWRYTINCHINNFLRLGYLYYFVYISVNVFKDFKLTPRLGSILWVSTRMNDAIHIKI